MCFLITYPAPDGNSVLVHEAHLDEFPKTQKRESVKVFRTQTHELGDGGRRVLAWPPDAEQPEPVQPGRPEWETFTQPDQLSLLLLGCRYLIFHLIGSQAFVDGVH